MQAERDTNGAIIQHWKPSDIEKVVIPIIDMEQQEKIAIKIKESFSLRKKSNELLDWAKRAVEIAIEQNEGVALQWLKEKSVLTRDKDNKVEFIAERSQVSRGIIEVLYLLRCSLMHGEVFPDNNAMEVYKYAYSILAAILKKMF